MVKSPHKVCAFCGQIGGGELGGLQNTTDKTILAHYNCLIFSPLVFTTDSEDDPKFVISSVLAEIKRGKSLKCSYCKQYGATIGCNVKRCQKTYHYECVEKDKGTREDEQYHVYCSKHVQEANKDSDAPQETKRSKTSGRPSTSKEMQKCSYCKKKGATIGCVIETCRKMYHISCVEEDEGTLDVVGDDKHVAYCFKHAEKHSDTPEDSDWSGSERPSTSYSTRPTVKRSHTSTPRGYSSPRGEKKNAEQDTDSSGSSERPSTSFGTGPSTRNRNSDQSDYSPRLANKKRSTAQEVERSRSSSSSASEVTPIRKMKRTSTPSRQIFKQDTKRTRRTKDNLEDQQTDTNDASNETNIKTTRSASPVKSGARRGRPPSKKKRQEAASKQKKRKTVASVDSEDIQQSDEDAETEEMNAQTSGEEIEVDVQASGVEREKVDARARNADKEITAEVESHKERTTPLSQHALNDTCIPSTSQARIDINELHFTKLYESQCKIANSIESGVSEFRNFAQQFQTMFKQFLDICQSLNHGICSNITNAHGQNTTAEVHHRQVATPDLLSLSHANSHTSTNDSANDADTNIDLLSPENTPTNDAKEQSRKNDSANNADPNIDTLSWEITPTDDAKEQSRKTNGSVHDADPNIDTLSSENTPSDAKEQSRKTNDSADDADPNIDTLSWEITPTDDADEQSRKTNGSVHDADPNIDTISSENTPEKKGTSRKTRSSLSGKRKRR